LFLDFNAPDFQEVLDFLRSRRWDPRARAVFTTTAARLARHLGVPVDVVVDELYINAMQVGRMDTTCGAVMFDLAMPGRWGCRLRAISFIATGDSSMKLFAKPSTCRTDQVSDPARMVGDVPEEERHWLPLLEVPVEKGRNRLELEDADVLHITMHQTMSLLLVFTEPVMTCSSEPAMSRCSSMSRAKVEWADSMAIVCTKGFCPDASTPFKREDSGPLRFFEGDVEYSLE